MPLTRVAKMVLLSLCAPGIAAVSYGQTSTTPPTPVAPAFRLTDGTNTVQIDSSGTVWMSPGCACSSAAPPTVIPGQISWSGSVGAYTVTGLVGRSKLVLTSPALDVGVNEVDVTNASTNLTISWTDTNFPLMAPVTITGLQNLFGQASASYSAYVDSSNAPFGTGTLVESIANTSVPSFTQSASPALASATYSMTQVETISLTPSNITSFGNDFGFTGTPASTGGNTQGGGGTPMISLTKTASATKVNPFQKVTYTYVVTNTGSTTVNNIVLKDDNATPDYAADDVTVTCPMTSLAAGASMTCKATLYPPVTEGANDSNSYGGGYGYWGNSGWGGWGGWGGYNYNNTHPGGRLICKQESNGDITFTYLVDQSTDDNTYGNGSSSGWGWWGTGFSELENAGAEFQVIDGYGNNVLDFVADYVSPNSSYPSGYGTSGVKGGGGLIYKGNSNCIEKIDTSITDNLNQRKLYNKCTTNSPSSQPNWENKCTYTVRVSCNAWGSRGFGGVACPVVKHSSKNYNCQQHTVKPTSSTETNTATVTAYSGTTQVTATAKATVTIDASQQGWSKCNQF